MLQMVKDYATWGEAEAKTLAKVIKERGKLVGDIPITDAHIKASTTFATIADFAAAIVLGKAKYKELKEVKPLFRLHPAMGGIVSVKRSHKIGGDLGYRGPSINELVERMIGTPTPHVKRVKDLEKWIHRVPSGGAPVHHEKKAEAKAPAKAPEVAKPKPVKKTVAKKAKK
jgi:large subunit ribosomal protein L30